MREREEQRRRPGERGLEFGGLRTGRKRRRTEPGGLGGGADDLGLGPRRTKAGRANPRSCGGEDGTSRGERRGASLDP